MFMFVQTNNMFGRLDRNIRLHHQLGKQAFVKRNGQISGLKKSAKPLKYTDEFLLSTNELFERCHIYIIASYKASNFSRIRQDVPNLFFSLKVYKIRKISVPVVFDYTFK